MKKEKAVRIVFIAMVVIAIGVYVFFVYRVNATGRKAVIKYYEPGEACNYKGVDIKVIGSEMYTMEEFREQYNVTPEKFSVGGVEDKDIMVCVARLEYTRLDEAGYEDEFGVMPLYWECVNDTWRGGMVGDQLYGCMEENNFNYQEMKKGETHEFVLPFTIIKPSLSDKNWEKVKDMELYLYTYGYEGHDYYTMLQVR